MSAPSDDDSWELAGRRYRSRLLLGTGKYRSFEETARAVAASGAEMVTVAVRRTNIGQDPQSPNLLDHLPREGLTILPNTAGCTTAAEAVRTARLGRELLDGSPLVKLEVIGDEATLYPDVFATLEAVEILAREGFVVMAYLNDDPLIARRAEEAGAAAVMPLGAPIGSGLGIQNLYNIAEIVERARVPVLVDAGIGTASHAAVALELGCTAVLVNTAVAHARDPVRMAEAMRRAVEAGRLAYRAGRMPARTRAHPSSPVEGRVT
jgi:thiazole synthase